MRALFIDSRKGGDWSLDLLFAGLVSNLGPENVIDYPSHEKHRMGVPMFVGDPERDWGAERMSLSYVPMHASLRRWSQGEVMDELRAGRIDVIFIDERRESYEIYLSLRANFFEVPVVVVSGHDKFWNESPDLIRKSYYPHVMKAMFLDNWRDEYNLLPNARVYNWSINFDHLWDTAHRKQEKVYDLSFMGYNSHPDRAVFIDHIAQKWPKLKTRIVLERAPNSFGKFIRKDEYFRIMAQSRICLNLRGAAENGKTLRFYEIPYVGACMLSQDSGAAQLHPFEHERHCMYFKTVDELDNHIDLLLGTPHFVDILALAGHEHAMEHHTARVRAKEMLEAIDGSG